MLQDFIEAQGQGLRNEVAEDLLQRVHGWEVHGEIAGVLIHVSATKLRNLRNGSRLLLLLGVLSGVPQRGPLGRLLQAPVGGDIVGVDHTDIGHVGVSHVDIGLDHIGRSDLTASNTVVGARYFGLVESARSILSD